MKGKISIMTTIETNTNTNKLSSYYYGELPLKLQLAKSRVIKSDRFPYLATALYAVKFIKTDKCIVGDTPTMACDKYWRLYYHPDVINKWSDVEIEGVLIHELNHLLRHHHSRSEALPEHNAQVMNLAQDLAINCHFANQKITLPEQACYPSSFELPDFLSSEEYYDRLLSENKVKIIKIKLVGSGNCGSAADGKRREWELEPDAKGKENNLEGLSKVEQDLIRRKIAQDIVDASNQGRGTIPGDLLEWAKELVEPQVNWRQELKSKITNAINYEKGKVDYTYSQPSRRQAISKQFIFPGTIKPVVDIAVILDTSGSMSNEALCLALSEVQSILKHCGLNQGIRYIACDSDVHVNKRISNITYASIVGRGGTDMTVAINAALALKPIPQILITLTDGYTPWPDVKPNKISKFIVGLIDNPDSKYAPDYARVVYINSKQKPKNT